MLIKKFICSLVLLSLIEFLPLHAQWHDWTQDNLNQVVAKNCSWNFSEDVYYQSPKSMEISYEPESTITFPYNYRGQSLGGRIYFLFVVYNPNEHHENDVLTVDFLAENNTKTTWKMATRRHGWNVYKIFQTSEYVKPYYYDFIMPLLGRIPSNVTQIRIHFPDHSGKMYIGKLLLCTEATYKNLNLLITDNFHPEVADAVAPALPSSVSEQQIDEISVIETRLDEAFDAVEESQVSNLEASTKMSLYNRYRIYQISRKGIVVNGSNPMLMEAATDYNSYRAQYGELAFDIAKNYRNVQNLTDKQLLRNWYFDLFDYAMFVGGMFDSWCGGELFTPSMFLMRNELRQTGRITNEVLRDLKQTIGFSKIYLDYSYFICNYMLYRGYYTKSARPYQTDEMGEDVDYLRLCSIRLLIATLLENDEYEKVRDLKSVSHYFSDIAIQYSPGIHDGFKEAGTLNHHWGWLDQYGIGCLNMMSRVVYALSNTEYRISPEAHRLLYKQLVSLDMRTFSGIIPHTLGGKSGEVYAYGGNSPIESDIYAFMALSGRNDGEGTQIDSLMASTFLRAYNDQISSSSVSASGFEKRIRTKFVSLGIDANPEPSGHVTYTEGIAMIHHRENWMVSIRGAGRYGYVRESSDPFVTYLGYGMLEVNNATWNRYGMQKLVSDFGTPGYDWRKMPGTTSVDFSNFNQMVNKEYKRYWPQSTFVGGVNQDDNGVFAMQVIGSSTNNLGSFRANKSYFCFDDEIVCVGSGIKNSNTDTTITTLFQDAVKSNEPTYVDSTQPISTIPYNFKKTLSESIWLMNSHQLGCWIPAGADLILNRASQTCPDWNNQNNVSGTFASAFLSHGCQPDSASYWYIHSFNSTPQQMVTFKERMDSSNPPYVLLRNDEKVQAVEDVTNHCYGVSVFDSSSEVNVHDIESVSRRVIMMVNQKDENTRIVSVADPDVDYQNNLLYSDNEYWGYSQPHEVIVKIKGNWNISDVNMGVSVREHNEEMTTLTFSLRNGLSNTVVLKNVHSGIIRNGVYPSLYYHGTSLFIRNNSGIASEKGKGSLFSSEGLKLREIDIESDNTKIIDVSDLLPGIYLFVLDTGLERKMLKFKKILL